MKAIIQMRSENVFFRLIGELYAVAFVWEIADAIIYKDLELALWALFYLAIVLSILISFYHDVALTGYNDAIAVRYGLLLRKQIRIEGSRIRMIVPTGKPARFLLRRLRKNEHHPKFASIHVYAGAFSDKCLLIVLEDRALLISCPNPDDLAVRLRELYGLKGTDQEIPDWVREIIGEF